jgi:hypothetical protein
MRTEELLLQIRKLLSIFVTEVKGSSAMGLTDINRISENLLIPIFREAYGYKDLKNLNHTQPNYPAVDLGDETRRVAIQVTSTPSAKKIKSTLETFFKHNLERKFDHLKIYILTEKQKQYSSASFKDLVTAKIKFDPNRDIVDYKDLLKEIGNLSPEKLENILEILNLNLGYESSTVYYAGTSQGSEKSQTKFYETNYLNLLELFLPQKVYIAELNINRKQVIEQSKTTIRPLKKNARTREVAHSALHQRGLQFSADWTCHENKVVTFHDLRNRDIPLSEIVDIGSVDPLNIDEFYSIDLDYENIFKALIGKCLQQKLYQKNVVWQHEEKMFIFSEINDSPIRKEPWKDSREVSRTVYEKVMNSKNPEKVFFCKHFGFRTRYKRFGKQWFLVINPDWFFSFDGYRRSFHHHQEKTAWLKRKETDKSVWNHLRFITHFLTKDQEVYQANLLSDQKPYEFLEFGNLVIFENAPTLKDADWLPKKGSQDALSPEAQTELPIEL